MGSAQDFYTRICKSHPRADQRRDAERAYLKNFYADAPGLDERPLPWQGAMPNRTMVELLHGIAEIRQAQAALAQKDGREAVTLISEVHAPGAGQSAYADYARLNIALASGRWRDALQRVSTPLRRPGSLFLTHFMYLEAVEQAEPKQAVAALEQSRAALSDPPELLPYSIRIYRRAGDSNRADLYYLKCRTGGDRQLMEQCEKARKG